jgi:hypothetical protein
MWPSLTRGGSITCASPGVFGMSANLPYYPQASKVGRFNRNLKAALMIYHHSQHTRRDENLLSLATAFNTAWHKTGATPASLFLHREINHPLGLKWKLHELELQRDSKATDAF